MTENRYRTMADEQNKMLADAEASNIDASAADLSAQNAALRSLVQVLETGLKIAGDFIVPGNEPFPGAALSTVMTSRRAVELARQSKLIPPRARQ